jgi:DNA-binding transcriptional LysR family regulator
MVMDVHGRDLRYFAAVAEELHFTLAAERLFISQPALSKQIRMLERQLGAPLFDRGRDGVRLTPVGQALLPHAREVLAAWDRGWAAVEQAKSRQAATLVAGMSTSPGRGGLLAAIRSRFTALQPAATVELRQASWGGRAARIGAEVASTEETYEALADARR